MIAALSVWRMGALYVPGTDPSRVYYGTDTRAFELLFGAAAGLLLGGREFGRRARQRLDKVIGWAAVPALLVIVVEFFRLDQASPTPFRGGLAVLALLAVLPIAASASTMRSPVQRLLRVEPLRRLGLISYSLYLWHWPVFVFLNADRMPVSGPALAIAQIAISVALAYATYRFVEQPIRRGGFQALIPTRPKASLVVTRIAVPALVVGCVLMPRSAFGSDIATSTAATTAPLTFTAPTYKPLPQQHSVMLIGNSIPQSLSVTSSNQAHPDLITLTSTNDGCDPFDGMKLVDGKPQPPSTQCLAWHKTWTQPITAAKPAVALFFVPQSFVSDYRVDDQTAHFGTPAYHSFINSSLDSVRKKALAAGAQHFAVATLACHRMPFADAVPENRLVNDNARVEQVNRTVKRWAQRTDTLVIDQFHFLCNGGFHSTINGVPLYKDSLHFSSKSGAIVWNWLAPQLQRIVAKD